jgi:hypothetical protein
VPESEHAEHASNLGAHESSRVAHPFWETLIEIIEVAVLALVAIATAWSGYQAAKWDGHQSVLYGTSSTDRFRADADSTAGGQEQAADASIFTAWLQATSAHNSKVAALYVRRFTPGLPNRIRGMADDRPLCQSESASRPGPYAPISQSVLGSSGTA